MAKVGRSSRTPYKHWLLNAIVGKCAGVYSQGVPNNLPFTCVDLCAGDGLETSEHQASPRIMNRHCCWLNQRHGKKTRLVLIEKDLHTYTELAKNASVDRCFGLECTLGDARDFTLEGAAAEQPVFVHCDPNNVHQTPVTKEFVDSWTVFTTYLATLGCNAGGIKMLPLEQREKWYEHVALLVGGMARHHDAILFWLKKDDSQWAYLLSLPKKWKAFSDDAVRAGNKMWPKGVGAISYRDSRSDFMKQLDCLFLTSKERGNEKRA